MLKPWFLASLTLLIAGSALAGPQEQEIARAQCGKLCRDKACESYEFHGFSKDSTHFGYAHLTCPGDHDSGQERFTWHLRRVRAGKRKRSTTGVRKEGVTFPHYFQSEGYWVEELPATEVGKNAYEFKNERGLVLNIELVTEKKVAWYFHVVGKEGKRFSYRGQFDEIYFGLKPRVFLSPDGERAAVVLLLDAMIKVDAALVVFSLNP